MIGVTRRGRGELSFCSRSLLQEGRNGTWLDVSGLLHVGWAVPDWAFLHDFNRKHTITGIRTVVSSCEHSGVATAIRVTLTWFGFGGGGYNNR